MTHHLPLRSCRLRLVTRAEGGGTDMGPGSTRCGTHLFAYTEGVGGVKMSDHTK